MSLQQSLKWRELLALWLKADGHRGVTHKPKAPPKLYQRFEQEHDEVSHLQGLRDWSILARWETTRDLATAMNDAKSAASHDGRKYFAAAWMRHGAPVNDAYVVMPLEVFSAVLHELDGGAR